MTSWDEESIEAKAAARKRNKARARLRELLSAAGHSQDQKRLDDKGRRAA